MKLSKNQPRNKIKELFHEVQDHTKAVIQDAAMHTGLSVKSIYNLYNGDVSDPRAATLQKMAYFFSHRLGREVTVQDLIVSQDIEHISESALEKKSIS